MPAPQSRLTAQGQISVPAEVRRKLGVGPGSVLECSEQGGQFFVRGAGRFSSADVHAALFGAQPAPKRTGGVKSAIHERMRRRHARD